MTTATASFDRADDRFESYYAEKLWYWIPEFYRELDGKPPNPGVLRAMVEIVAQQAAVVRRDVDRVWDDQAIELCDQWAISYLGELVGALPLSGFNARGNRVAAAKAVYYQRRKGTPGVMQELIRDIAALEGVVVEAFRRLVRFPHRLDIDVIGRGRVTESPVGGLVDLRNARVKGLTDSAFDEAAHFADVRRQRGPYGRYGLRKVNFHLFPLRSYPVTLPTPVEIAPGRFTLDPSGRDVALFQRGQTSLRPPDAIRETDLPDAILCRRLNATRHELSVEALGEINDPVLDAALAPLIGLSFRDAVTFRRVITPRLNAALEDAHMARLLDVTLLPEAPKAVLWPDSLALAIGDESADEALPPSAVIGADLGRWETGLTFEDHVRLAIDPATGRVVDGPDRGAGTTFAQLLHYGQFAALGAGTYGRGGNLSATVDSEIDAGPTGPEGGFTDTGPQSVTLPGPLVGTHRFTTSKTYEPTLPAGRIFGGITEARLEAADGARPHIRFRPEAATMDITFRAAPADGTPRRLEIDGLWIGMMAETIAAEVVADGDTPATPVTARLILDGDFDHVLLRSVTLDPGGERARNAPDQAIAIPYVRLEIEGQVSLLEIQGSITGPIHETNADPELCNAGRIEICDSVVQSADPGAPAVRTRLGHVHLVRTTVFGRVEAARLYATDSIVDGRVRVTDNQHGCLRYSATGLYQDLPGGPAVLPPRFEALAPAGRLPRHWITSRLFGDAWFATLSSTAPETLTRGAENGAEMGVFNARGLAILLGDLAAQVVAMMPVGQTPQYLIERDEEDPL